MKGFAMGDHAAGSYAFGTFDENQDELARLKQQAAIVSEMEGRVLREVGLKPGMRALDLACGPGIVTALLAEMVTPADVIGVDLSEDLLHEAHTYLESRGTRNATFQQGDVYSLDESLGVFDFIYTRFLFQHLADPKLALSKILPRLSPGGRLCVVDIDDAWLTLHPEPAGFRTFTKRAAEGQSRSGGDRNVGRKLGGMLQEAGLEQVDVHVTTVNSHQLGMRNFLDITTGFKKEQVAEEHSNEARKDLEEIYKCVDMKDAWGFVAVFVATGIKGRDESP